MTSDATTPDFDRAIGFTLPDKHARGRIARLGPVVEQILAAHDYPPVIERLLGEALALTALLGTTLKDAGGQLTMQAQTQNGIVDLMVCDYKGGELRGYVQYDPEKLGEGPDEPSLFALFGNGFLGITFDQVATGERYQGIVPLDGATLSEAAESYFAQSEQIPSLVRLTAGRDEDGRMIAAGMFLQHLPEGEEGRDRIHTRLDHPEWQHVETLAATMGADELANPDIAMEALVWRLYNEEREVRTLTAVPLSRGCRCDADYIGQVLAKFPESERAAMADENGMIGVDCAFCAKTFPVALEALKA